jgi:SAM-dependent methyltransferase
LRTTKNDPARTGTTYNTWEDVWNQKLRRKQPLPWEAGVSGVLAELVREGAFAGGRENWAGLSVLDVGCGSGLDAIFLRQAGFGTVVGIDISPSSILLAEENLKNQTDASGRDGGAISFQVADFFRLGEQEQFDLVWDRGLYHNLRKERQGRLKASRYAQTVRQLLRPGGDLFVLAAATPDESTFECPETSRIPRAATPSVRRRLGPLSWLGVSFAKSFLRLDVKGGRNFRAETSVAPPFVAAHWRKRGR